MVAQKSEGLYEQIKPVPHSNTHNTYESWATNENSINKAAHRSHNTKEAIHAPYLSILIVKISFISVLDSSCNDMVLCMYLQCAACFILIVLTSVHKRNGKGIEAEKLYN